MFWFLDKFRHNESKGDINLWEWSTNIGNTVKWAAGFLLSPTKPQESKKWEMRSGFKFWIMTPGPFNEGFPQCSPNDGKIFEIITSYSKDNSERHTAHVVFSDENNKKWEIVESKTLSTWDNVEKTIVAAWKEVSVSWEKK